MRDTSSHTSDGGNTWHSGPISGCAICFPRASSRWQCPSCSGWVDASVPVHYCPPVTDWIPKDQTSSCPCRPENGGSGVCGCVLGSGQFIC